MTWHFLALSRKLRLVFASLLLLGLGWGGFEQFVDSDGFRNRVREAIVRELERASGGAVSIEDFRSGTSRLSSTSLGLRSGLARAPTCRRYWPSRKHRSDSAGERFWVRRHLSSS